MNDSLPKEEVTLEPEIVGWSVHSGPIGIGAMYNLQEREKALDAAARWNCAITALVAHPTAPKAKHLRGRLGHTDECAYTARDMKCDCGAAD